MPGTPLRVEESEDCEELDEDYFMSLGNTFSVVDAWNENDEVQVKKDPDGESNHSKASSKKSDKKDLDIKKTSSSKDPRSNAKPERKRASPERKRSPERRRPSPERNRVRLSPRRSPERNRNFRPDDRFRRSPPRFPGPFDRRRPVSPERNRNQHAPTKKPFLLDLQEQLMQKGYNRDDGIEQMIQQGGRVDLNNPDLRQEPPRNFQNRPMHFNNQPNMPVFIQNEQMMPQQQFNPMMIQQMQQMPPMQIMQPNMMNMPFPQMHTITPPVAANIFANPLEIMQSAPLPVPPPQQFEQIRAPGTDFMEFSQISPPILHNNFNNNNGLPKQPTTIIRDNVEHPPRKKTPNELAKNLTDLLRQKSKQNTRSAGDEEIASRKAKVLERCKSAVGLISDLEQNKSKIPLTCVLSNQNIHKPNITVNKSPLLTSEKNPRFLFQATPDQCFSVLENHPLRNIYGETAEIAQYLKLDLHELSSTVARESIITQSKLNVNPIAPSTSGINNNSSATNIFTNRKTSTKEVQTEPLKCKRCHQMDIVKQSARSIACQTNEVHAIDTGVQSEHLDGNDGFRVYIDAQTLADRNFEQHHALEVFSKAFNIPFIDRDRDRDQEIVEERPPTIEESDERWNYTNPENPNQGAAESSNFFSTSPIHKRPTSPTLFKTSDSPPRFRTSNSPPLRFRTSNSPPRFRTSNSPPRNRSHRSVFERIGEKIPDHVDSPRNYDDWNDEYDNRPVFRPYTIPSPNYVAPRERSPEHSRRYRNRSRSLSRSPSRSPKRYRGGNKILSRRGRY